MLFEWAGRFFTDDYPSQYPKNSFCIWLIRLPKTSKLVRLDFFQFHIQSSSSCKKDYIKIYDGLTTAARVFLDKTCGKKELPRLMSSSNVMLIEFASDAKVSKSGFAGTYNSEDCGATLTEKTGEFSSPKYPAKYPKFSNCYWTIIAPRGHMILIEMKVFKMEFSFGCESDFLSIRDGGNPKVPIKVKHCGTDSIPSFKSSGSLVMLHFSSDGHSTSKGFLAKYTMNPSYRFGFSSKSLTLHHLMNGYVKPWTFLFCIIIDLTLGYTDSMISFFT
nr:PREDICTED: embryonic protein UVS.2-like [Latimeria chalumnae]|eukprot:XP_014352459.1 PREDICTED: embryonic protein UVS.2-like [Latimeria chalumnae]